MTPMSRGESHQITTSDAAVPTIGGSILPKSGAGRIMTANTPIRPTTTVTAYAAERLPLTARLPTIEPITASENSVPRISTALSAVPNQSIAQSLTAGGTTSITSCPTGTTGEAAPRTRPTTSSAAARPAKVERRPIAMP